MSREQNIEALADKYAFESPKYSGYPAHSETFKAGILAGVRLRDEELLAMEFDKEKCRNMAQTSCDEEGYWQHEANIYIQGYKHGAGQQHEQFIMKAIKGE